MKIIAPSNQIIYLFGLQVCLIMRVHFFKLRLKMGRSTDVKTPATTLTCNCFGRGAHPNGLPPLWSPQLFCVPIQSIGFKLTCCQCSMYTTCCVWPTNSGRVVAQQLALMVVEISGRVRGIGSYSLAEATIDDIMWVRI